MRYNVLIDWNMTSYRGSQNEILILDVIVLIYPNTDLCACLHSGFILFYKNELDFEKKKQAKLNHFNRLIIILSKN